MGYICAKAVSNIVNEPRVIGMSSMLKIDFDFTIKPGVVWRCEECSLGHELSNLVCYTVVIDRAATFFLASVFPNIDLFSHWLQSVYS